MRIGLFSELYYPYISGVVTAIDIHKRALEAKGHQVFIITIDDDKKSHRVKKEGNILKIPGIPSGLYDYNVKLTYPITAVKKVKDLKLDLIHTHTEFGIGRFGKSMAKRLGIPHIHTFHTLYEKALDYLTKGKLPGLSKKAMFIFVGTFLNDNIKEIIVPGEKTRKSLLNNYKVKCDVNKIPTGIDLEQFEDRKYKDSELKKMKRNLKINEDDFLITFIGRLGYEKNIHILIDSHAKIVANNKNAKLLIVGGGPEEEILKALVKRYKIEDNVIFTGKVNYEDIGKYYKLATVLATASDMETQGLTVMEAFASGKPVVCLRDDAFLDAVTNGVDGFFFKNRKEYIKIINKLIVDKPLLKLMSRNAKEKSLEYSLDKFGDKLLNVYMKALEKNMAESYK